MGKAELKDFSVLPGAVPDKLKASVEPTSPGMKRIGAAKKGKGKGSREDFVDATHTLDQCTDQHLKLLYLVSLHARCAPNRGEKETWIRRSSVMALVYEAILEGALQYDYAPQSTLIGTRHIWANISQDATDNLDDLVAAKMLRELRMFTRGMQPVQSLQVSELGMRAVRASPNIMHRLVEEFAFHDDELVQARWAMLPAQQFENSEYSDSDADDAPQVDIGDGDEKARINQHSVNRSWWEEEEQQQNCSVPAQGKVVCVIYTQSGLVARPSGITEIEDVSYVTSPYLPQLLINAQTMVRPLSDYSSRAAEAAAGLSLIRDELDEAILLGGVRLMVGEWIPMGLNQIVYLNDKLGTSEQCTGGMRIAELEHDTMEGKLETATGLTDFAVIDAHPVNYINLEAQIKYPEEEGVVQLENFGVHLNHNGGILYGLKIEAVHDRRNNDVSLDMLARVIVDVHADSAKIVGNLLSVYQRDMLEAVYGTPDHSCRERFNCLIAGYMQGSTRTQLDARRYLDGADMENEIKQVIGAVKWGHNLSTEDVLILGRRGMLVAGPNVTRHEDFISLSIVLLSLDLFLRVFFTRMVFINQELVGIRKVIENSGAQKDASRLVRIQTSLSRYSRTIVLLIECLQCVAESLDAIKSKGLPKALQDPWDITGRELLKALQWSKWQHQMEERVVDLQESMLGCQRELRCLRQTAEWVNDMQLHRGCERVKAGTKSLAYKSKSENRSEHSLQMMQVIISSTLAWTLLDRFTGFDQEVDFSANSGASSVQLFIITNCVHVPLMNFMASLIAAGAICYTIARIRRHMDLKSDGLMQVSTTFNANIDTDCLALYLDTKDISYSRIEKQFGHDMKIVRWQEVDDRGGTICGCRKRSTTKVVLGAEIGTGREIQDTEQNCTAVASPTNFAGGVSSLKIARVAAKKILRRTEANLGWNGLRPPLIELVIDIEHGHLQTATFNVDTKDRPAMTQRKLGVELPRLFVFQLERAGVVAPGSIAAVSSQ